MLNRLTWDYNVGFLAWKFYALPIELNSHCGYQAQTVDTHIFPMWLLPCNHLAHIVITWGSPSQSGSHCVWISWRYEHWCDHRNTAAIFHHKSHIEKTKVTIVKAFIVLSHNSMCVVKIVLRHLGPTKRMTYSSCLLQLKRDDNFLFFSWETVFSMF